MAKEVKESTKISKIFRSMEEHNYMVFTFSSNHPLPKSAEGFTDHFITHKRKPCGVFIEDKIGKDTMKERQKDLQLCISHLSAIYPKVAHRICTSAKDAEKIRLDIYEGKI